MEKQLRSFIRFLRSSKRTIKIIVITVVITFIITSLLSALLSIASNLSIPSLVTIKTLGVEAYLYRNLEDEIETFDWGIIRLEAVKTSTFYLRSISNIETTLYLTATNWDPVNVSNFIQLSWNYNGTTLQPGEILEVILTLSSSSSYSFRQYLIRDDIKEFSFDIGIYTSEYYS